ncbi:FMN-dependent oxidoreductase, nitrilotriacetate monooxygenase family [Salinibacillus kushneri]|uniref:FMN-dependent oxidoreductase, nitrilotriacetate monooxygenase family n=1 Tax=Salinibacillus kushneri TaxID=237682 RepID=A0A1H9Z817_9BACI|nr:LLM class flavin-dependent oxidoreductase [Salinibacillus kushneri]SES77587.1 FMN-dependent oxidoreductase, nitrilotriacetate monooxygenase family [Salinibacillus kushneri]
MSKQIHLNGFIQNSPSPHSTGLWKHEKDKGTDHNRLDYWVEVAQIVERGKFDALFIADVLGTYSVYENSHHAATRGAVQLPAHDALIPISAMAAVTENLGFAPTISATYAQPYALARQLSTLDHLTDGRIAWNVVTSYLESEAINLGLSGRLPKNLRYDRADEFLEVVYKLWEQSWEKDSVVYDKEQDAFADPEKVHLINHEGEFFNVPGPHLVEPSPQRTPVLFQAGASPRGRDFAAKHAEAVFTKNHSLDALKQYSADIRRRTKLQGRSPDEVLIFPMILPIIGSTEEEAYAKLEDLTNHVSYEGTASLLSGHTGIDFSKYDPDQYIEDMETDAVQGNLDMYAKDPNKKWTLREAVKNHGLGNGTVKFIGTPEQIADKMEQWAVDADVDGFNIAQTYSPGTLQEFVDYVVPELQRRGIYRTEYEGKTLRENMFGKGKAHLPKHHPAKKLRTVYT